MKILIILTIEQIQTIETYYPQVLAQATHIISLNLDVSARLWQLELDHLQITDFLSLEEIRSIQLEGIELLENWFAPIESKFQIDGINPLQLERIEMVWCFHQMLLAKLLYTHIMDNYGTCELIFFDEKNQPSNWGSITVDAFPAVWKYLLEQDTIKYHLLNHIKVQKASYRIQGLYRGFQVILNSLLSPLMRRGKLSDKQKVVFSIAINEAFRFSVLSQELRNHFGKQILLTVNGSRSSKYIRISNDLIYYSIPLTSSLSYLRLLQTGKKWFKVWQSVRYNIHEYPEIFQNKHLDYQFRYLFSVRLPNAVQTFRDATYVFRGYQSKVLLTTSTSTLHLSSVVKAAQLLDISIITLPHSGTYSNVEYQTPGDITVSWTQDMAQAWKEIKGVQSLVIGLPDSIVTRGYQQSHTNSETVDGRRRITLLLATVEEAKIPEVDVNLHRQTLETILDIPSHLQEKVEIILKLHPAADYQYLYKYLVEKSSAPQNVDIIRNRSLEDILVATDLALLVNMPTSAYFLPLAMGIPEIYITTAGYNSQTMRFAEWGGRAVIRQQKDIWKTIEAVLFDEEVRSDLLRDNQAYWERINAGNHDPMASLMKLISDVLAQ